jgi:hypothetical protein
VLPGIEIGADGARIFKVTETSSPTQIQFATPAQLALLRAALLDEPEAAAAAKSWFTLRRAEAVGFGLDALDLGSRRLLPLAYRNLKTSVPAPLREELRLIHHEYWVENQKRLHHLESLLSWFEAHKVPTLILKGMALSLLHYHDMAARPCSDLDILVPEDRAQEVIDLLEQEGWAPFLFLPSAPKKPYFYRHTHAMPFKRPGSSDLDLHWHVLTEATFQGADRRFWCDSVPVAVKSVHTRALNPTDQLLHACIHGFRAAEISGIRWIADAIVILRTAPMDWIRLAGLAKDLHVTLPLALSLSFLRATFPTPIPEEVVEELRVTTVDAAERRYFETLVHHNAHWRDVLVYNLERHRRANRDRNPVSGVASFPRQLQLHYNLPDLKHLGRFAFARFAQRLGKRAGLL